VPRRRHGVDSIRISQAALLAKPRANRAKPDITARDGADMLVRPYGESDEAAVVALWQQCGLTRPWNDPRKDIARKLAVQREMFLVGESGGAVIATAMGGYDGHRGWVNYLAVAPAHRLRGHAAHLMRHLEGLLSAAGCPKINLQVRASNAQALAFYGRLGYAQDDVISLGRRLIPDDPTPN
jgi:ribosomal protein S18 acetylase RimI-like enzyme